MGFFSKLPVKWVWGEVIRNTKVNKNSSKLRYNALINTIWIYNIFALYLFVLPGSPTGSRSGHI